MNVFLAAPTFIKEGGDWILDQITTIVIVVLVLLAIKAWINKEYMTVFTSIIIGGIIMVFAMAEDTTVQNMGNLLLDIFGLKDDIN
ncbi:TcpD family membrane protein [Risungbinella massiliensis]|uniref:TcpD family membrane protein n=1 Tax=Risungbinella massiliensis TaxID=1329796 RepID=UPI0005CC63D6|nr:TcpD family membrane protein [Risungbinella massiliensis]